MPVRGGSIVAVSDTGLAAGVDQGLLELLGVGATGTAGFGDVHESVHF